MKSLSSQRFVRTLTLTLAVTGLCSAPLPANEAVYQKVVPSTVMILTPDNRIGSGTLIDVERRLVITANHVPGANDEVTVLFADFDTQGQAITSWQHYLRLKGREGIRGTVVARLRRCDLALLQLDSVPPGRSALPLSLQGARPGQAAHVIGHSNQRRGGVFGYSGGGKVRNVYDHKPEPGLFHEGRLVETSVATNKGDSGGPVVNDRGELIGVVSIGTIGSESDPKSPFYHEQLVDVSIDVTEVRKLVATCRVEPAGPRNPMGLSNLPGGLTPNSGGLLTSPLLEGLAPGVSTRPLVVAPRPAPTLRLTSPLLEELIKERR
jgi:S1-C subfamily serine protease